jgi:hypothetical protein
MSERSVVLMVPLMVAVMRTRQVVNIVLQRSPHALQQAAAAAAAAVVVVVVVVVVVMVVMVVVVALVVVVAFTLFDERSFQVAPLTLCAAPGLRRRKARFVVHPPPRLVPRGVVVEKRVGDLGVIARRRIGSAMISDHHVRIGRINDRCR